MSHSQLTDIFGKHIDIVHAIENKSTVATAEAEYAQCQRSNIQPLFYTHPDFPQRLNENSCTDAPTLIYKLGNCDLNATHTVAFVGSRKATDYGRNNTRRLVSEMKNDNTLIVSGLAYGIDTAAHQAALENGLPTVAVLGHGLDRIYPDANRHLAKQILEQGGALLTEYRLHTPMNAAYFPARNRIIAGMSDATVVVEAAEHGGALITANIANSYQREVFAVPGRLDDPLSYGTNNLICNNKAIMLRNAGDLFYQMGWKNTFDKRQREQQQAELFATLTPNETLVVELLKNHPEMLLDQIVELSGLPLPKVASIVSDLEFKQVIHVLPGRLYKLMR